MTGLYAVLAGLAAVALLALLYGRGSRRLGRAERQGEMLERALEAARKAEEIDEAVAGLADDDLYGELRRAGRGGMRLGPADRGGQRGYPDTGDGGTDRRP